MAIRQIVLPLQHESTAAGNSVTSCHFMRKCTACREYRIPIKAALNGTAGVHSLKVAISPAATVANQKAADYKYGVPGLTQPGALLRHNMLPLFTMSLISTCRTCFSTTADTHYCPQIRPDRAHSLVQRYGVHFLCRWPVVLQLHPQACLRLWLGLGTGICACRHLRHCGDPGIQQRYPDRQGLLHVHPVLTRNHAGFKGCCRPSLGTLHCWLVLSSTLRVANVLDRAMFHNWMRKHPACKS